MENNESMKGFGEKLKQARKAAGMSQQGMADRMLIPKRTIEKWETGDRTPPEYVQRFVLNELVSLTPKNELLETMLKSGFSDNEIKARLFLNGKTMDEINREIELAKNNLK
jgi:transcriptional regulator with XRE-family HTH domain